MVFFLINDLGTLERVYRRNIGWSFCGDLLGIGHLLYFPLFWNGFEK